VIPIAATAFSGWAESTCTDRDSFKIPQNLNYMKAKFWSSGDLYTGLPETSRADIETSAQLCGRL